MTQSNAIDFHSRTAADFDKKYSSSKNFKERYAIWTRLIDKYSDPAYRVLDLGCGSGIFTTYLSARNKFAVGLDGSTEMLKICQARKDASGSGNMEFIQGNANALTEIGTDRFDMIVCSSVLEYLDDLDGVLEMIASSLNQNGVFICSLPNRQSVYRTIESIAFKMVGRPAFYRFVKQVSTLSEAEQKLRKAGLTLLESAYYAATPILSQVLRPIGLRQYSDNLFVTVARRSAANTPSQTSAGQ